MPERTPVVVFDFDHTLTAWDTASHVFKWLLKRKPWRVCLVAVTVPVLSPLLLVRRTRGIPVRYVIWVATLGLTLDGIRALAETHVDELHASGAEVFLSDGLRCLDRHVDEGYTVVIATGCLEPLAAAFLRRAGYGHITLVASSLKRKLAGIVGAEHCHGARKVQMIGRRGYPPPWSVGYTDHHADLPMLRECESWFLVNASSGTVERARREFGRAPEVLRWQ